MKLEHRQQVKCFNLAVGEILPLRSLTRIGHFFYADSVVAGGGAWRKLDCISARKTRARPPATYSPFHELPEHFMCVNGDE
jgi:hypothetical protein